MRKLGLVIKREYLTRVRTKGFVISTVAIPVLIVAYMVFVVVISTRQGGHTVRIAILDEAGGLAESVVHNLNGPASGGRPRFQVIQTLEKPPDASRTRTELRKEIRDGALDAFLVLPAGALKGEAAEFYTKNPGDLTRTRELRRAVSDAVVARRLDERGIRLPGLDGLMRGVDINLVKVTRHGESREEGQTLLVGFIMAMVLYSTLIFYGVATMRSVLEEKTTHIVEILASSLRPLHLLAGKILGVAAVALTQYLIWTLTAAGVGAYGATLAASMHAGAEKLNLHISGLLLVYLVLFFLAGYFLYAALYAAVGAACSNEQDAQQLQIPVILPLILALVFLNLILNDPNSTVSTVLSMIPFFAPILMVFRIALQTPPFWQIALSLGLTVLTTLFVMRISARIYRVGILMYGKRPSLVELFRWLRYT